MQLLRTVHRLLLWLAPAAIRRDYGDEMDDAFAASLALEWARRGRAGRAVAVARGLAAACLFGVRARWEGWGVTRHTDVAPQTGRSRVLLRDIKGALRALRVQPVMSAAIVAMFALGIGATTAIFSVVYGVLLRPLPFPDPDRLVQIWSTRLDRGWATVSLTEGDFWELHDRNQAFVELGAYQGASFSLTGAGLPERVNAGRVSAGFFRSLAAPPVAGRLFEPDDDQPGKAERTVLLSHGFWTRRFAGDPSIVGRDLTLDGSPYLVVGVLPLGSPWLDAADLFVPFVRRAPVNRSSFEYSAIGRLKPGVTQDAALADLARVAKQVGIAYPATNANLGVTLQPARTWMASDDLRRTLWVLLGAVGLLLAIACVNVTNLLLARASSRARESAVRAALGATRSDLIRERLAESLFYSASGGLAGLAVAYWMLALLKSINPTGIPRLADVAINGWIVGFATATAAVVGILAGVIPAVWTPIGNIAATLRPSQRGAGGERGADRLRGLLIVAEVALSLVLLVGAGLLVRSLLNVLSVDRGFTAENRLLMTVSIPGSYGPERIGQLAEDIVERVGALPQIAGVASVSGRPLSGGSTGMGIAAADAPDMGAQVPWATWRIVTKDYFSVMGVPILSGRGITDQDEIGKPWRVVISKRTAELLWPGQNAVGRTALLWKGQDQKPAEVIGVVSDMRERGLERDPTLAVYLPARHTSPTTLQLVMHSRGRSDDAVAAVRTVVSGLDANLPVSNIRTLEDVVSASVATRRMTVLLLVTFAAVALVLALAGVYGVLSYSIARRTPEIGVRLALGADHGGVLRLVMVQGLRPVMIGTALGLAATFWLSRLMSTLLFALQPNDPATYAAVAFALGLVATVACYIPARRVLRVDPAIALRAE